MSEVLHMVKVFNGPLPVVEKNLAGVEDLAIGEGAEEQTRNGQVVQITKVSAKSLPWDSTKTIEEHVNSAVTNLEEHVNSAVTNLEEHVNSAVTNLEAHTVAKDSNTGSAVLPAGTTAERTVNAVDGAIRLNTELSRFEGYNAGSWGNLFESNGLFYENTNTITSSYTVPEGKNAMTAGPISIANSAEVTVSNGSVWTVV